MNTATATAKVPASQKTVQIRFPEAAPQTKKKPSSNFTTEEIGKVYYQESSLNSTMRQILSH